IRTWSEATIENLPPATHWEKGGDVMVAEDDEIGSIQHLSVLPGGIRNGVVRNPAVATCTRFERCSVLEDGSLSGDDVVAKGRLPVGDGKATFLDRLRM